MYKNVLIWLADALEAEALSWANDQPVATTPGLIKGFPAWRRSSPQVTSDRLTNPVLSLLAWASPPPPQKRIGQNLALYAIEFEFYIFARDELELVDMIEHFWDWSKRSESVSVNDRRINPKMSQGYRFVGTLGIQQEAHAWRFLIQITW